VEHREVAADPGRRNSCGSDPLLRHAQRETTQIPVDQHRVAVLVWILVSAGFGLYLANFATGRRPHRHLSYNKTYGSLAGVIVFLLWLWITNLALLFGAEVDAEIERGRQLQAGIPAEEDLQLPHETSRPARKLLSRTTRNSPRPGRCGQRPVPPTAPPDRPTSAEKGN